MKRDQQRVRAVLADTVTLLCRNGLTFHRELRIQGVIGITIDESDTFIVHINETFDGLSENCLSPEDSTSVKELTKTNFDRTKQAACAISGLTRPENLDSLKPVDDSINSSTESCKRDRRDSECAQQRPVKVARRSSFSTVGHAKNYQGSASLDGFTMEPDCSVELRKTLSESGRNDNTGNEIVLSLKRTSISVNDSCTISSDEDNDEEKNDNDINISIARSDNVEKRTKPCRESGESIIKPETVRIKPEANVASPRSPRIHNLPATVRPKISGSLSSLVQTVNVGDANVETTNNDNKTSHTERFTPTLHCQTNHPPVKAERSDPNDSIIVRDVDDDRSMDRSSEHQRAGDFVYPEEEEGRILVDEEDWDDNERVAKLEPGWIDGESFPYTDHSDVSESNMRNWIDSSNRQRRFGLSNSSEQLHLANSQYINTTAASWRRHSWGRNSASAATDSTYFSSSMFPGVGGGGGGHEGGGGPGYEVMSRFVCSYPGCGTSFSNKQNLQRHQTHKHGREKTYRNRSLYF